MIQVQYQATYQGVSASTNFILRNLALESPCALRMSDTRRVLAQMNKRSDCNGEFRGNRRLHKRTRMNVCLCFQLCIDIQTYKNPILDFAFFHGAFMLEVQFCKYGFAFAVFRFHNCFNSVKFKLGKPITANQWNYFRNNSSSPKGR